MTNHQSATVTISIARTDGTVLRVERVLIGADEPDAVDLEVDAVHTAAYAAVRKLRATPLTPPAVGRHADEAPTEPSQARGRPAANTGSLWVRPPERDATATTVLPRVV